jgi:hypothetical protein
VEHEQPDRKSESEHHLPRRVLLTTAGLTAAGALGVSLAGRNEPAAAEASTGAINVKDAPYGAKGDGTSDDRPAIQAALDAVGGGGAVFFPPGDYVVRGPLIPKSFTILSGTHTPTWQGGIDPPSPCKIRVGQGFAGGEGLIVNPGGHRGITLRNLALVGAGVGQNLHGVRAPNVGQGFELGWTLENLEIAGFTGDGIFGRVHVATLLNCYIHDNNGWGINASQGQRWNDCHVFGCFLYFNQKGNLYFGGTETSAAVSFVNCRFERAGVRHGAIPGGNAKAPGARLANCRYLMFANCDTDANNGNGFEIIHEPDTSPFRPEFLTFVNCDFRRDGIATDQENFAAVKVRGQSANPGEGVYKIKFLNCTASWGAGNDFAPVNPGPRYGVWYENTVDFQWVGTSEPIPVAGAEPGNAYFTGAGNNVRPLVVDMARSLFTIPAGAPDPALSVPDGAVYLDAAAGRLNVRVNGAWKSVALG